MISSSKNVPSPPQRDSVNRRANSPVGSPAETGYEKDLPQEAMPAAEFNKLLSNPLDVESNNPVTPNEEPFVGSFAQKLTMSIAVFLPLIGTAVAIAWMWQFGWMGWMYLGLMIGGWYLSGMGITIGFHRMMTHRSFESKPFVRWFWTVAVLSLSRDRRCYGVRFIDVTINSATKRATRTRRTSMTAASWGLSKAPITLIRAGCFASIGNPRSTNATSPICSATKSACTSISGISSTSYSASCYHSPSLDWSPCPGQALCWVCSGVVSLGCCSRNTSRGRSIRFATSSANENTNQATCRPTTSSSDSSGMAKDGTTTITPSQRRLDTASSGGSLTPVGS